MLFSQLLGIFDVAKLTNTLLSSQYQISDTHQQFSLLLLKWTITAKSTVMKHEITDILLRLQQLFHNNGLGSWARKTERTLYLVQENQYDLDLVLDNYIGSGMDSLQFVELDDELVEELDLLCKALLQQNEQLKLQRNS